MLEGGSHDEGRATIREEEREEQKGGRHKLTYKVPVSLSLSLSRSLVLLFTLWCVFQHERQAETSACEYSLTESFMLSAVTLKTPFLFQLHIPVC